MLRLAFVFLVLLAVCTSLRKVAPRLRKKQHRLNVLCQIRPNYKLCQQTTVDGETPVKKHPLTNIMNALKSKLVKLHQKVQKKAYKKKNRKQKGLARRRNHHGNHTHGNHTHHQHHRYHHRHQHREAEPSYHDHEHEVEETQEDDHQHEITRRSIKEDFLGIEFPDMSKVNFDYSNFSGVFDKFKPIDSYKKYLTSDGIQKALKELGGQEGNGDTPTYGTGDEYDPSMLDSYKKYLTPESIQKALKGFGMQEGNGDTPTYGTGDEYDPSMLDSYKKYLTPESIQKALKGFGMQERNVDEDTTKEDYYSLSNGDDYIGDDDDEDWKDDDDEEDYEEEHKEEEYGFVNGDEYIGDDDDDEKDGFWNKDMFKNIFKFSESTDMFKSIKSAQSMLKNLKPMMKGLKEMMGGVEGLGTQTSFKSIMRSIGNPMKNFHLYQNFMKHRNMGKLGKELGYSIASMLVGKNMQCTFCHQATNNLTMVLKEANVSLSSLKESAKEICTMFNQLTSEQCDEYLRSTDGIMKQITEGAESNIICKKISFCNDTMFSQKLMQQFNQMKGMFGGDNTEDDEEDGVGDAKCDICRSVVGVIKYEVDTANATIAAIEKAVKAVCDLSLPVVRKECYAYLSMIDTILQYIMQGLDPEGICEKLHVCNSTVVLPTRNTTNTLEATCTTMNTAINKATSLAVQNLRKIENQFAMFCSEFKILSKCFLIQKAFNETYKPLNRAIANMQTCLPQIPASLIPPTDRCTICKSLEKGVKKELATIDSSLNHLASSVGYLCDSFSHTESQCDSIRTNFMRMQERFTGSMQSTSMCNLIGLCTGQSAISPMHHMMQKIRDTMKNLPFKFPLRGDTTRQPSCEFCEKAVDNLRENLKYISAISPEIVEKINKGFEVFCRMQDSPVSDDVCKVFMRKFDEVIKLSMSKDFVSSNAVCTSLQICQLQPTETHL